MVLRRPAGSARPRSGSGPCRPSRPPASRRCGSTAGRRGRPPRCRAGRPSPPATRRSPTARSAAARRPALEALSRVCGSSSAEQLRAPWPGRGGDGRLRERAGHQRRLGAGEGVRQRGRLVLPLLVRRRVRALLHGLRGDGELLALPAGHLDQRVEELAGRVPRVEDLPGAAPALGRPLLEQPDRVAVAVLDVDELRLLQRGGQRDGDRPRRQLAACRDRADGGRVGRLLGAQRVRRVGDVAAGLLRGRQVHPGEQRVHADRDQRRPPRR